jgi:SPX domain protein involved in polyphosphate accumulation
MKFGKLLRHTVDSRMPQWRNYTLGYKPLKQHIKQLQAQLAAQGARSSARLSSRLPECTSPLPHHACTALSQRPPEAAEAAVSARACGSSFSSLAYAPLLRPGISPDAASSSVTAALDLEVEKVNDFYMDRIEEAVIILHSLKQHAEQLVLAGLPLEQRTACQRSLVAFHYNLLTLQNYVALNFTAVVKILKKSDKKIGGNLRNDYVAAMVELPFYRCQALGELVEDTEKTFRVLEGASAAAAAKTEQMSIPMQQQPQMSMPMQQPAAVSSN